jgi:hypothetical protein
VNLHLTITTVPHPEDIAKGAAEPIQSTRICAPEELADVLRGYIERANACNIWADRGGIIFLVQPLLTPKAN